ncbi:MAG: hypothetical protein BWY09_02842 [Candidatus Hydrogenedentes bacterium ADurb.Bin179]|nr:MAG: hypothetical protein BWY09_02842 [Candidatus Hydrogenedentes bacterium ADurb.Bin179]
MGRRCAEGEEAEFITAVYSGKKGVPVFKIVEACEGGGVHEVLEEELSGVVGGDAGGQDTADAAAGAGEFPVEFGEDGVYIYPSPTA